MKDLYQHYLEIQQNDGKDYHKDLSVKTLYSKTDNADWSYLLILYTHLYEHLKDFSFFGADVLDIGAREFGTNDFFLQHFNRSITGIDINLSALKKAEIEKVDLRNVDAHYLLDSFEEKSFDLVLAFHTLEHMFDMAKVISNCFKVLRPGGYFYAVVPTPCGTNSDPFRRESHWQQINNPIDVKVLYEQAGFTVCWDLHLRATRLHNLPMRGEEYLALLQRPL